MFYKKHISCIIVLIAALVFLHVPLSCVTSASGTGISGTGISDTGIAFSLRTLIDIALENNLSIKAEKAAVEQMESLVDQVNASQEWRVDGLVNIDHQQTSPVMKMLYGYRQVVIGDSYSTTTGTLAISKPLFLSEKTRLLMDKTEKGQINAEESLRQIKMTVVVDVVTAFYNVFRASDGVRLARKAVDNAERALEIALEELAVGKGTPRAVSNAELELKKATQTLGFTKDSLRLAENNLSLVVGKPGLKVEDLIYPDLGVEKLPSTGIPWTWSLEELQYLALDQRPESMQGAIGVEVANIELHEAELAYKPTVTLEGSYLSNRDKYHAGFTIDSDYRFIGTISKVATSLPALQKITINDNYWNTISDIWNSLWANNSPSWTPSKEQIERWLSGDLKEDVEWRIMLKVQFNIFDSNVTAHAVESKEKEVEKALAVREQIEQGIFLDVTAKYIDVLQMFNSVQTADMALAWARQHQEDAKVMIEVGMATQYTQDLAYLGVIQAENALRSALYDYEIAKVKLAVALGLDMEMIFYSLVLN